MLALSGGPGPKLREGDRQAPEGLYPITYLNPNSLYHLSLRIGYPSAADKAQAAEEGRGNLGGDIMIHGEGGSIGCFSIANADVEEVFTLAADVGIANVATILAPHDLRMRPPPDGQAWMVDRYGKIQDALARFK